MRRYILSGLAVALFGLIVGCNGSSLSGAGKTKSGKSSNDGDGDGEEGEDGETEGADDATDGAIVTDEETKAENGSVDVAAASVDGNGILKDECKIINELPTGEPVDLELLYEWHASGAKAAFTQMHVTPVVGRLRPTDEAPTIIAVAFSYCTPQGTTPGHLFAIDGKSGSQKWDADFDVASVFSAAIGDIDNSGEMSVVVVGYDMKVHALDADGKEKWVTTGTATGSINPYANALAVADLDLDDKPEVIGWNHVWDGATGKEKFSAPVAAFSVVGDTNGEPGFELVTSNGIYSGKDGAKICAFSSALVEPAAARFHQDHDHGYVVGFLGGKIAVLDGQTCAEVKSFPITSTGSGPITIADLDGDQVLDFANAGYSHFMTYTLSGPLWDKPTQDHSSSITGSTTFDLNGDGKTEVIYADEVEVRVFDGSTGRQIYTAPNMSDTTRENPIVVDVDGDGTANIVVGSNSCQVGGFGATPHTPKAGISGIRVFKSANNDWVNTRDIWNQHTYNPVLVKSNGGLTGVKPEAIWKPWLKSPHLVGFRNNIPKPAIKPECK